ncbi:hypothetical protein AXG93_1630s1280 [Marchantia polymorpha subsp. ruderalis]|uniref:Uncharacterized protein n=1 Tax=Marchantia polymorpha subsp. ruderalis TaxID=1480154 RepID=A0A176VS20_MARPO|nr:hypothetical protein AXG93_1630s1280 [Marchantia polymorpha subsp. ruderalis]
MWKVHVVNQISGLSGINYISHPREQRQLQRTFLELNHWSAILACLRVVASFSWQPSNSKDSHYPLHE